MTTDAEIASVPTFAVEYFATAGLDVRDARRMLGFLEGFVVAMRLAHIAPDYFAAMRQKDMEIVPSEVTGDFDGIVRKLLQRASIAVEQ